MLECWMLEQTVLNNQAVNDGTNIYMTKIYFSVCFHLGHLLTVKLQ